MEVSWRLCGGGIFKACGASSLSMRRISVLTLATILGLVVLHALPWRVAGADAKAWYAGDPSRQLALARGVRGWLSDELDRESFTTGSDRFDAEWLFGTHFMAAMGFGQVALAQPEHREEMIAAMDHCLARMSEDDLQAFDREAWGEDALTAGRGHVAYLGYHGLALSLRRRLGASRFDGLNDAISAALLERYQSEPLVETYPGERYPVDNASAIGALALWAKARGEPAPAVVVRFVADVQRRWRDPESGLLVQSVDASLATVDGPRASGTALAAYFLSFADEAVARSLYESLEASVGGRVIGFGAMAEYPRGHGGAGDVDSGPLIAGYSISGTGFSLSSLRRYGTADRFAEVWATTALFGLPRERDGRLHFAFGGPLGDAILFAMLTARSEV